MKFIFFECCEKSQNFRISGSYPFLTRKVKYRNHHSITAIRNTNKGSHFHFSYVSVNDTLNPFYPMSRFYTPWKRQKTIGFLTLSGGIEIRLLLLLLLQILILLIMLMLTQRQSMQSRRRRYCILTTVIWKVLQMVFRQSDEGKHR